MKTHQRVRLAAIALVGLSTLPAPSAAAECLRVTLPDSVHIGGRALVLNGMGVREATVFDVDVYVAGLYIEHRSANDDEIVASDTAKRLVLRFVRDVGRDQLVEAMTDGFRRNAGAALGALQGRLDRLNAALTAMTNGQSATFTYVPGAGLEIAIGGRARATIGGADFARVFFSIWLGPHPPNAGLKRGLLGGRCG
jgi:hypothetical protein